MKTRMRWSGRGSLVPALLATCALPGPALAQDADFCRNGLFGEENHDYGVAEVAGSGRLYFLDDMDGCPNTAPACRQRAYVIPRDRVVTGRTKGDYVCAYFPNDGGGTAGWVARARLRPVAIDLEPALDAWNGEWADGDNYVDFSVVRDALWVEGQAYWPSANPSLEERPGGPNVGEIAGVVQVEGNRAFEPECEVRFTLLGDYLLVSDPMRRCDGANVTFSGVYTRPRR